MTDNDPETDGGTETMVKEAEAATATTTDADEPTPETETDAAGDDARLLSSWIGGTKHVVWSDGETQNAYEVELDGLKCDCKHGRMNEGNTEACRHIKRAIAAHHDSPDLEHAVMMEYASNLRDANDLLRNAQDAHDAMKRAQEAYEAGVENGDNPGAAEPTDTGDTDDDDLVTDLDPTDEAELLMDKVYEWLESAQSFDSSIDPDIVDLQWSRVGGNAGMVIDMAPWNGSGYWDSDDGEWQDKDGYDDAQGALRDLLKNRDEVEWYGDPDYINFLPESKVTEVVG